MKAMFAVLLVAMAVGFTAPAEAQQQVKYLVLGADPQASDRQPTSQEEVVVIDHDLCDPAWGTGSGKKVAGCYPVHSAVIRNKLTGIVSAMYFCGNEPGAQHLVTGKVIPAAELVLVPGPQGPAGPIGPQGPQGLNGLDGLNSAIVASKSGCGDWCKVGIGVAILATGIAVGEHNDWWRKHQGPTVTSDDGIATCTGDPCPGAPTVGAPKMGGFSFAFPIR